MKVLVIGGTGPTGPFVVNGFLERGYDVSILNRGSHHTDEIPASVVRILGDPHFGETLRSALSGRSFDLIVASYGRLRVIAEIAGDYTDRLISIGGAPGYRGTRHPEILFPEGVQVPLPEDAPKVKSEGEFRFGYLVKISEDAVMEGHDAKRYIATHLRYPLIYGPRQPLPCDWWLVRRLLDKRKYVVLPDGGLTVISRGYAENMANAILLAADQQETAAGKIYNCGDDQQLTLAQWVQVISNTMDTHLDIISVPAKYSHPVRDMMMGSHHSHHLHYDTHLIRSELGYKDTVPVLEAFRRTVDWYLRNPPELNKATEGNLAAQYEIEDALAKIHGEMLEKLEQLGLEDTEFIHPYAHPKKPGAKEDHLGR